MNKKKLILAATVALIAVAIFYLERQKPSRVSSERIDTGAAVKNAEKEKKFLHAAEIQTPAGFVNSEAFTIRDLIGKKVILVDFWTYSCINCQRTTPYLVSWYEKYRDQGLEIIGVHTPEFEFEKRIENVSSAVEQFGIQYPVVLDNDYGTWNAYANRYWPHKYLVDIDGYIIYDHIGEGGYEETERKIQDALKERMARLGIEGTVSSGVSRPEGVEAVDFSHVRSPEIYFGASRNSNFGNGYSGTTGTQTLKEPPLLKTSILYLSGVWDIQKEFSENKNGGAKIIFRYKGNKVFMVARSDKGATIEVLRDGKPVGVFAGSDVNKETSGGVVKEDRLYRLIEDTEYGEHTLEIIIKEPGLQAFTFTFG